MSVARHQPVHLGLNALTGIDGIWTDVIVTAFVVIAGVLMPLRALMGFGRTICGAALMPALRVLMPLRALMGFGHIYGVPGWPELICVLMPLRALMGFGPSCRADNALFH